MTRFVGLLVVGVGLVACGSDGSPLDPLDGEGVAGRAGSTEGASGEAGQRGGSGGVDSTPSGGGAGWNSGGGSGSTELDAGIVYSPLPSTPDPPQVGDRFVDEDQMETAFVFPPDAGLVADAGGVEVGEIDPDFGVASACLHVDLQQGSYQVASGNESPDSRLERVVSFDQTDSGFEMFAVNPWSYRFLVPSVEPRYLPTDSVSTVEVTRGEVVLLLRFQVQGNQIAVLSVTVEAI